ncbi:MAG: helix-turn-helix domain-containing protein [Pseudomonadota bacterium]
MDQAAAVTESPLGSDLRALRQARGLTLTETSEALGRSVGWLSQVERDMSVPTVDDLRALADLFEVNLSIFFSANPAPAQEAGVIVRQSARRAIGDREPGLTEELLSPDLTDDFEMVHSVFAPGSAVSEPVSRPTQEVAVMLSGKLDLTIDGRPFTVASGDSFRIRGVPFTWSNPYSQPAVAIWVIAPPVY